MSTVRLTTTPRHTYDGRDVRCRMRSYTEAEALAVRSGVFGGIRCPACGDPLRLVLLHLTQLLDGSDDGLIRATAPEPV